MATTNLNIKINPEIDVEELKNALKKLNGIEISPDVNTDAIESAYNVAMNSYEKLEKAMSNAIELDVNSGNSEQVINELYDAIHKIENEKIDIDTSKLAQQFAEAENELKQLLETQSKALAQMKITGQQGTGAYKELEAQLQQTKSALKDMTEASGEQGSSMMETMAKFEALSQFSESMSNFAEKGLDVRDAMIEVQAQTGATSAEMGVLKVSAENAFRAGVGDSVAEAVKALGTAKQMLGQTLDPKGIDDFIISAQGIAKVFDKDINEVIAGSRTFIGQFGLSGKEAGDLISLSMQKGGGKMDDVLDTLDEYSQLVKSAGFSAQEFTGIITTGMESNVRDTDKLADAIKETQIRLNAGDTAKAIADIKSPITATIQGIEQLASSGQISVKEMLQRSTSEIEKAFANKQISAALRDQFNTAISGTMAEDIGGMNFGKIFSQQIDVNEISKKAAEAGNAMKNAVGSVTFFEGIQREFDLLTTKLSEFAGPVAGAMSAVLTPIAQVAPGITLLKDTFGDMATSALASAKSILVKLVPSLFTQTAATAGATTAQYAFNTAALANPYILGAVAIAAAIGGIIALAYALSESTQDQLDNNAATQEAVKSQMDANKSKQEAVKSNQDLIASYEELGNKANRTAQEEEQFKDIQLKLAETYPGTITASDNFNTSLSKLKGKAGENKAELGKLANELESFQTKANSLQFEEKTLNIKLAQESIEDNTDNGLQDQIVAKYANAMNNAANSNEVKQASYDMKMALVNSEGWADMDAEEKKAVMSGVDNMAKAATEKAELAAKQSSDIMNNAISNIATNEGYNTTVEAIASKSKKSVGEVSDAIIKNLAVQKVNGKDTDAMYQKVADTLHKSPEEIKKMVAGQNTSKEVAEAQKKSVQDIADAWNKAKTAVDANISTQRSLYAQADKELKQLRQKKDWTDDDAKKAKELTEQKQKAVETGIKEGKVKKDSEKTEAEFDRLAKLKVEKGKTALELAQQEYKNKSDALENENQAYEQGIKRIAASEKRKLTAKEEADIEANNLKTIKEQKQAYIDAYEGKKLISSISPEGVIEYTTQLKNKTEAQNQIKSDLLKFDDQIITIEGTITPVIDTKALNNELLDAQFNLDKKKLEIAIEAGKITGIDSIKDLYSTQFDSILSSRTELTEKLKTANETEKIDIQKKLIELQQKEISLNEERSGMYKQYSDKKITDIEESYEKEDKLLADKQSKDKELFERIYNIVNETSNQALEYSKNKRLDGLDAQMNAEISRVGDNERAKTAITEKYNKLKEQAEREFADKSLILQSRLAGEKSAFEDAQLLESSEKKKKLLQAEYDMAIASGDVEKAKEIKKQIDDIDKTIQEGGDLLGKSAKILGSGLEDSLTNAFAGNGEGAKKGMKATLAQLAGYIKQLATAKVLEIVLSSKIITGLASLAGPAAPLVLAAATALINAGIGAILNPILGGLLSFPTGAGYINEPTMFVAGDGGRLGGENKEVLLRDDQFKATLDDVLNRQRVEMANMVAYAISQSTNERLVAYISGGDLAIALQRYSDGDNQRIRTKK